MSIHGDSLIIISGYNFDEEDQTLPSIQFLTARGPKKETKFPSHSRLSAAVTLSSGIVVVTGGRGSEKHVFMSTISSSPKWEQKQDMLESRKGHASAAINVGKVEVVVVAGGWDYKGDEMDSVHMYSADLNKWDTLPKMLAPRVDFALHFQVSLKAVNMISYFKNELTMSKQ